MIDFRWPIYVGNLAVVGVFALFAAQWRNAPDWPVLALFAAFLLNFQCWSSMFWAMAATTNFGVVLLGFLSISCLFERAPWAFVAAMLAAVLATFCQGNGLLIWPLGLVCLLRRDGLAERRKLFLWSLLAVAAVALYFWDFDPVDHTVFGSMPRQPGLGRAIVWFLSFLGAGLTFESRSIPLAASCGALVLLSSVWAFFFFERSRPAIAFLVLFLLGSAALATAGRYSMFELTAALESRYRIYSSTLVGIGCAALVLRSREFDFGRWLRGGLAAFAVAYAVASYTLGIPMLLREQLDTTDSLQRWLLTQQAAHFDFFFRKDVPLQLQTAIETRVWDPRGVFPDMLVFRRDRSATPCRNAEIQGVVPYVRQRTANGLVGEIRFSDERVALDHFDSVLSCRGERVYIARPSGRSRSLDGSLILHYLMLDPVENADTLLVRTVYGNYYRAELIAP